MKETRIEKQAGEIAKSAWEKEFEKGIVKGIEKGIMKGIEKGIEKGREEDAIKMLKRNFDFVLIQDITGLSFEKIQELKDSLDADKQ